MDDQRGMDDRLIRVIRRARWLLPVALLAFVVIHQAWETLWIDRLPPSVRLAAGLLVYGLIGPLAAWWTLDWVAAAVERRRSAEATAHTAERDLAAIVRGSADAIIGLDQHGIVRSWNRGASEMFGYSADAIIGHHITRLLPDAAQPRGRLAALRETLSSRGSVRGLQARCRRADGRLVHVDVTQSTVRDALGGPAGSSLILRDMTARIAAERAILELNRDLEARVEERTDQLAAAGAELRRRNEALADANARLEQLDALKDEFVALVSHELRAPLTNIAASAELLKTYPTAAHAPAREKLDIIIQEVDRLARLVRGVLDVSRIQAGHLGLDVRPVAPAALCARALDGFPHAERVSLLVAPDLPEVAADFDRAVQVLVNLLDNAVKYSSSDRAVTLSVEPADRGGSHVAFRVRDDGVGILQAEQEHIFDRFHRLEHGDDRRTYGHGLGLYIARHIAQAHNGWLEVESEPGCGSVFELGLPIDVPMPIGREGNTHSGRRTRRADPRTIENPGPSDAVVRSGQDGEVRPRATVAEER